jgi:ABC-2 type transport system permease protein
MLNSLFGKTVRDLRGQVLGWGVGIGLMALLVIALYPSFKESMADLNALLASYPDSLKAFFGDFASMGSLRGWMDVEFFSWIPPILAVFAVGAGAALVGGEEAKGTMDLLLSYPIRRWRVVAEKFAALVVATMLIMLIILASVLISVLIIGEDVHWGRWSLAILNMAPTILVFGAFACSVSAVTGRRRLAAGLSAVLVVGSFFLNGLGKTVELLEPYRPLSVFYYYQGAGVVTEGLEWGHVGLLLAVVVVLLVVALIGFQRRDVAV